MYASTHPPGNSKAMDGSHALCIERAERSGLICVALLLSAPAVCLAIMPPQPTTSKNNAPAILPSPLPSVYLPASDPSPAAPERPISAPDTSLPTPPDLLAHVTRQAESSLPAESRPPLLLLRVSMLLQDAVEAACMCTRALIDAPLLAKHLLGAEQHQQFLQSQNDPSSERAERINDYAKAVSGVVGEAHAQSLGAVLHHLCCSVMDAVGKLPPTPPPAYSMLPDDGNNNNGGTALPPPASVPAAGTQSGDNSATTSTAVVAASATTASPPTANTLHPSSSGASSISKAELLPIDRALVTTTELRQTCNAIELLRSAVREGSPVHEWTLRDFSQLGPGKVSSAPFELYGRRWSLLLHPRGCGANAQGTHVSAYLRLEHGPACDARVRLAVRNHHSPALSTFNKPWQWRFESNGKNRGVSSLLPLASANAESGFIVDDVLVLQLWLRPLGAAESRCLPPSQEDGLPQGDMLQPAARRHFHSKLLLSVCKRHAPRQIALSLSHIS